MNTVLRIQSQDVEMLNFYVGKINKLSSLFEAKLNRRKELVVSLSKGEDDWENHKKSIIKNVSALDSIIRTASKDGCVCKIDIGIYLIMDQETEKALLVRVYDFSPQELKVFEQLNISLELTMYIQPASIELR